MRTIACSGGESAARPAAQPQQKSPQPKQPRPQRPAPQAEAEIGAAQVQFLLVPEEIARQHRRLTVEISETEIRLTF